MYTNAVLSFLGAYQKLQSDHRHVFEEIQQVLNAMDLNKYLSQSDRHSPSRLTSPREFQREVVEAFARLGWNAGTRMSIGRGRQRFREIDAVKDGIELEMTFAKSAFIESALVFKFPLFVQAGYIRLVVILVPMDSLLTGASTFKVIRDQLIDLSPLPLKYPFAILGISDRASEIAVEELTSAINTYLLEEVGVSLDAMRILGEKPEYDFKERPPDGRRVSELVCALANLEGGGAILVGVNDDGEVVGIPRDSSLDATQLAIISAVQDSCRPRPRFELHAFEASADPSRCVLVVRVHEVEYKPCMVDGRVYVRMGASTRAAGPDEIRRLLLK